MIIPWGAALRPATNLIGLTNGLRYKGTLANGFRVYSSQRVASATAERITFSGGGYIATLGDGCELSTRSNGTIVATRLRRLHFRYFYLE